MKTHGIEVAPGQAHEGIKRYFTVNDGSGRQLVGLLDMVLLRNAMEYRGADPAPDDVVQAAAAVEQFVTRGTPIAVAPAAGSPQPSALDATSTRRQPSTEITRLEETFDTGPAAQSGMHLRGCFVVRNLASHFGEVVARFYWADGQGPRGITRPQFFRTDMDEQFMTFDILVPYTSLAAVRPLTNGTHELKYWIEVRESSTGKASVLLAKSEVRPFSLQIG